MQSGGAPIKEMLAFVHVCVDLLCALWTEQELCFSRGHGHGCNTAIRAWVGVRACLRSGSGTEMQLFSFQRKARPQLQRLLEYEVEMDVLRNTQQFLLGRLVACRQTARSLEALPDQQMALQVKCPLPYAQQGV